VITWRLRAKKRKLSVMGDCADWGETDAYYASGGTPVEKLNCSVGEPAEGSLKS
jgi:hypothetical protein